MQRSILAFLLVCFTSHLFAQDTYTEKAKRYVAQYRAMAIAEQKRSGVPAAITLGQGILETEAGSSVLATGANNHFGIKCKQDWTGETFFHTDDAPDECFRKYKSAGDSYKDHSNYLKNSPRYASLFTLSETDYAAWAYGLKKCGYATNPRYAQKLIQIIEDFHLQDATYAALNDDMTVPDNTPAATPANTVIAKTNNSAVDAPTAFTKIKQDADQAKDKVMADSGPAASPYVDVPPATRADKSAIDEVIVINGLKAIYAFKGESLLKYATKYNIRYAKLLEMNDLPDAPLPSNMYIYLERKNANGAHDLHIVKPGETMLQVAQLEGMQLKHLLTLNKMNYGDEATGGSVLELKHYAQKTPELVNPGDVVVRKGSAIKAGVSDSNTPDMPVASPIAANAPFVTAQPAAIVRAPESANNTDAIYREDKPVVKQTSVAAAQPVASPVTANTPYAAPVATPVTEAIATPVIAERYEVNNTVASNVLNKENPAPIQKPVTTIATKQPVQEVNASVTEKITPIENPVASPVATTMAVVPEKAPVETPIATNIVAENKEVAAPVIEKPLETPAVALAEKKEVAAPVIEEKIVEVPVTKEPEAPVIPTPVAEEKKEIAPPVVAEVPTAKEPEAPAIATPVIEEKKEITPPVVAEVPAAKEPEAPAIATPVVEEKKEITTPVVAEVPVVKEPEAPAIATPVIEEKKEVTPQIIAEVPVVKEPETPAIATPVVEEKKEITAPVVAEVPAAKEPEAPAIATPAPAIAAQPKKNKKTGRNKGAKIVTTTSTQADRDAATDAAKQTALTTTQAEEVKAPPAPITATEQPIAATAPPVIEKPVETPVVEKPAIIEKPIDEQPKQEEPKDDLDRLKQQLDKVVYRSNKKATPAKPKPPVVQQAAPVETKTDAPVLTASAAPLKEEHAPVPTVEMAKEEPVKDVAPETKTITEAPVARSEPEKEETKTENPADKKEDSFYTVKKGDTAFTIAKSHKITMRQLMNWNNMDFDEIKTGQRLKVKE